MVQGRLQLCFDVGFVNNCRCCFPVSTIFTHYKRKTSLPTSPRTGSPCRWNLTGCWFEEISCYVPLTICSLSGDSVHYQLFKNERKSNQEQYTTVQPAVFGNLILRHLWCLECQKSITSRGASNKYRRIHSVSISTRSCPPFFTLDNLLTRRGRIPRTIR
jgi:hypothetical protein